MVIVEPFHLWGKQLAPEPEPAVSQKPSEAQLKSWQQAYQAADAGSLGVVYHPPVVTTQTPEPPPPPAVSFAPTPSPATPDNYGSSSWANDLSDSELTQRIDHWPGTDNDPILDRLVSERNQRLDQPRDGWESFSDYQSAVATFEQNGAIQDGQALADTVNALRISGGYVTQSTQDELDALIVDIANGDAVVASKVGDRVGRGMSVNDAFADVTNGEIGVRETSPANPVTGVSSTAQKEPEVYGPPAPPEYRLERAAEQYAGLSTFIGPLLPGTRQELEDEIRVSAEELGLDSDEVMADLHRDLAFRHHQPNGFDFREDVVEMSRAEWTAAIGPHPELRGIYYGGGAVQGPDGQMYPLVIPTVNDRGTNYNADQYAPAQSFDGSQGRSVENHLGEEPGWTTLGTEAGPARFGDKPSGWDRFFAFWGGTAGYQPLGGSPLRAEGYEALQVSPTGYPSLLTGEQQPLPADPPPATMPGDPPRVNYVLVEGRLVAVDPAQLDAYNRATRRAAGRQGVAPATSTNIGAVAAGADLAVTIGQGLVTTLRLDDGNNGYYQLVFQESEDGDRRAMLRAYSMTSQNGEINIWPTYVTLDEHGELQGTPIRFRHPDYDVMSPIPDYNVVQLDS